jgi:peptidoglycan hydrolase-like protein with peptidoglycan-binding domain
LVSSLVASAVLLPASEANAASIALVYHEWASAGITLSQGQEHNTVGFWQAILKGTGGGQNLCIDGDFGPATRSATILWQSTLQVTQDGIVGPQTWNATFYARNQFGGRRLVHTGNQNYYYYAGLAYDVQLKKATWSGVYQWGFWKPVQHTSGTLHNSRRDQDTVSC